MAQQASKKNKPVKGSKPIVRKAETQRGQGFWWMLLVIAAATFVVYLPALKNGFVNLDDDRYIYENPKLFLQSIGDMFSIPSGYHMGNYHPFTMLIYKIVYGYARTVNEKIPVKPYPFHLLNVLLHIGNSLLAFFFVRNLTRHNEIAFAAALLFGVHALHVESVAWVSELKDLLYAGFFFASLICYLRYLDEAPRMRFYVLALLLFACSCFSKGQAVSLSVVLLLIDYYRGRKFTQRVWLEKAPYFALSVTFGIIAVYAQKSMAAIQDIALFHFYERIVFACYGFVTYLWKLVLPLNLSAYYSYPVKTNDHIPYYFYLYPIVLLAVVGLTLYSMRRTKKIFFGVGFFSVTVFLVLQLLPVGGAIMADRYAYIPSLGIFYLFAEGLYALYQQPPQRIVAISALALMTCVYGYLASERCKTWKDGMTMWSDVIEKSQTIELAYNNRGVLFNTRGQGRLDSVKIDPSKREQANSDFNHALDDLNHALALNNKDTQAWSNRGLAFWRLGKLDSALYNMNHAVEIDSKYSVAWSNMGSILFSMNRADDALHAYEKAVEANPSFSDAWYNIGILKINTGRKADGCEALNKAAALGMQHAADAARDLCK